MTGILSSITGIQADAGVLTVTASPSSVFKITTLSSDTSGFCTALPSGGSGSYSFSWTKLTNDYPNLVIDTPISASTTFSVSSLPASDTWTDTVRCTVTDTVVPSRTGYINVLINFTRL